MARFASLNESDFDKLLNDKDAENTQKATKTAIKIFRSYLAEKELSPDFESLEPNDLDSVLCRFYAEARTVNGELYKRSTLFSIRYGLNRHLSVNSQNPRDIIHGEAFRKSQCAFTAATKELKRSGKGGISHYPPIEQNDLTLMYQYFDLENNVKLQEKVFVDIVLYFGRRGRGNLHQLRISDFSARHDAEGHLYIYLDKDELTKNHQENANTAEGRMDAMPDDPLCPVKSFMKYKKHLNPNCDRFFQRPKHSFLNSQFWFDNVPLGHNTIGNMMAGISEKAGLSQRYTNHSLRATLVQTLDPKGGNKIPKQQTPVVVTSIPHDKMVIEIKEEVTEIDDSEALSREINNLDKFRDQQKMIEEANKQRKALLSKTLTERQKKAREEAQKLSHIQKELQLLDNRLSADVTLIRSRIESSSKDYMEAQRRYDRAEREFIEAKMDLQKKSELKEQLTEHLYTIIHQNELRKAEKLSHLMNELQVENESEGNGVSLPSLPPLSAFNVGLSTLTKTHTNDPSASGSSSTKPTVKSSEWNKPETHNKTSEASSLSEETTNNSVCHFIESQNVTDNAINNSASAENREEQGERNQENSEQPRKPETMLGHASSVEKEKSVPTSWTLDVIIKQEPEENG